MKSALQWFGLSVLAFAGVLLFLEFAKPGVPFAVTLLSKLGGNIFSGFLTLGGFLLAMKNLVILRLQEKVYDTDGYRQLYESETGPGKKVRGLYDPLVNLTGLLVCSVGACLASSVAAVVASYSEVQWLSLAALSLGLSAISLVFKCWWEMHANFREYFKRLEAKFQGDRVQAQMKAAEQRDANRR